MNEKISHKIEIDLCDAQHTVQTNLSKNLESLSLNANTNENQAKPLAVFGVLADIQYANANDRLDIYKTRYYRNSLNLIAKAVNDWKNYETKNDIKLKFLIQLGDLIDRKSKTKDGVYLCMNRVLDSLNQMFLKRTEEGASSLLVEPNVLHVWGNHDLSCFMREDLLNLPLNTAKLLKQNVDSNANYYVFDVTNNLKLICLDFFELSTIGYSKYDENYLEAKNYLHLNRNQYLHPNLNGTLLGKQIDWLSKQLAECRESKSKAIVCGHLPVNILASNQTYLAWDNQKILNLFGSYNDVVIAYLAGHNHQGGYNKDKYGIYHITLPGIVETHLSSNSYITVEVFQEKVVLNCNFPKNVFY